MRKRSRRTAQQIQLPMTVQQGPPSVPEDRAEQLLAALADLLLKAAMGKADVPVEGGDDEPQDHR